MSQQQVLSLLATVAVIQTMTQLFTYRHNSIQTCQVRPHKLTCCLPYWHQAGTCPSRTQCGLPALALTLTGHRAQSQPPACLQAQLTQAVPRKTFSRPWYAVTVWQLSFLVCCISFTELAHVSWLALRLFCAEPDAQCHRLDMRNPAVLLSHLDMHMLARLPGWGCVVNLVLY